MAKNRRKRRRKRRGGQASVPPPPRPSSARNRGAESQPDAVVATVTAKPSMTYKVGDVVSGRVTYVHSDGGFLLDVDGWEGGVLRSDLALVDEESAQDRYAVSETIKDLFVWGVIHETRTLALSLKRAMPDYVEALQQHEVGNIVSGTVTAIIGNDWFLLDVDGLVGSVAPQELDLAEGKSAREHYAVDETIKDLLVWQVNYETRTLHLSVKRNTPGYLEALQQRAVGDVVSGTVTFVDVDDRLWLNVDGLVGSIARYELVLADGESARDRYAVGETIEGLFVWQVDRKARVLALSIKRNAPGYEEALQRRAVGDVVSGTVTSLDNYTVVFNVDGLVGGVLPWDFDLADGESARDRYAVGKTIDGLFVWQVNHETRLLGLSAKRNAPSYVEALGTIVRGDDLDGVVAWASEWAVLLDAAGVVGWIPARELALDDGESPQTRYTAGDPITARVWQIDHEARDIILSVRRLAADFTAEPIEEGATIDADIRDSVPGGYRVLAESTSIRVPYCELSLSIDDPDGRDRPRFEYGQRIRVVVLAVDSNGRPTALSHRRALPNWQAEVDRLAPGAIVQNAQIIPLSALPPNEDRLGLDLGPVTGFVNRDEVSPDDAQVWMLEESNQSHGVVVESVSARIDGTAIVSRDKFATRWTELAEAVEEGQAIEAELRKVGVSIALLDLGSGLLAETPVEQLPERVEGVGWSRDRIVEKVTLRIKSISAATHTIAAEIKNYDLMQMIADGENLRCEFKRVFKGSKPDESRKSRDPHAQDTYRGLPVLEAVAGMMNAKGGHVLVGVEDPKKGKLELVGWRESKFETQDQMKIDLSSLVRDKLSGAASSLFDARFEMLPGGIEILDIECRPADQPIFVRDSGSTKFLVRHPAATQPLDAEAQHTYIQERFPSDGAASKPS